MKHVTERIAAWLAGELAATEAERLAAHLDDCPECAREAARAREAWDLLAAAAPDGPAAPSVWPAVRARTFGRGARPAWFYGRAPWLRACLAGGAVAAGLLLSTALPGGGQLAVADDDVDAALWIDGAGLMPDAAAATTLEDIWLDVGSTTAAEGSGS